ncbi:unnamed protein product, partial [Mesorhabditis spiculigera]
MSLVDLRVRARQASRPREPQVTASSPRSARHFLRPHHRIDPFALTKYRKHVLGQISEVSFGTNSLLSGGGTIGIVFAMSLAAAMMLGVETHRGLELVGMTSLSGMLSAVANTRELAPVVVAIASGLCASRTTDALDSMAVNPSFLAGTRVIAAMICVIPIYMIGLLASYLSTRLVVVFFNGASAGTYDYFFHLAISPQDLLYSGLKAVVFAAVVALVHCAYGYYASGGPAGVGQAAGRALRTAILAIGILDVLMTFALWGLVPGSREWGLSRGQTHYTPKIVYALRGAIAVVVAVAAAVTMVLRGSGNLEQSTDIFVAVPATAGLISGEAPSSTDDASKIPADVVARVVPRTLFGDIYMQLVDSPNEQGQTTLSDGDEIHMDDGPGSRCALRRVHQVVGVLTAMQPEKLQTALTALGQALDGNGAEIGTTIDNLSAASGVLTPAAHQFLESTPEFKSVVDALDRATPTFSIPWQPPQPSRTTWSPTERISESSIGAAAVFAATVDDFVVENNRNIITVIDSAGKILATTAANPGGLRSTLANASTFGAAGARVFATGKFDITAVATFAEPLPYTGDDCPQYGDSRGAQCSGST